MHTACLTSNFISFIPSAGTGGRNLCKSYMAVQPSFSLIFISFYTIYLLQRILPSFFIFLPWLPCHFYRPSSNKQNSLKKNSCSPVKKKFCSHSTDEDQNTKTTVCSWKYENWDTLNWNNKYSILCNTLAGKMTTRFGPEKRTQIAPVSFCTQSALITDMLIQGINNIAYK